MLDTHSVSYFIAAFSSQRLRTFCWLVRIAILMSRLQTLDSPRSVPWCRTKRPARCRGRSCGRSVVRHRTLLRRLYPVKDTARRRICGVSASYSSSSSVGTHPLSITTVVRYVPALGVPSILLLYIICRVNLTPPYPLSFAYLIL